MVAGNITYDSSKPLFADLENGDFRPTADSQLRDIVPAAEWMGNGKLGSKSDIGSGYELQPAGTYGVNVVWTDAVPRLSTERLRADTGWEPAIPVGQTLRDLLDSVREP